METIVLKNKSGGFGEIITDFSIGDFKYNFEENDDRSLEFSVVMTLRNQDIFEKILPDMLIQYEDNDYTIINVDESEKNSVRTKTVNAKHVFMESQFLFIDKDLSQETLNDTDGSEKNVTGGIDNKNSFNDPVKDYVYNFMKGKDFSDYQTFGVMGNIQQESGFKVAAEQYPGSYSKGGKGLLQWDDRKFNLYEFAENNNSQWQDIGIQMTFMWNELQSSESVAYKKLKNSTNLRDATLKFHDYYERSADTAAMKERRVKYAQQISDQYNKNANKEKYNSSYLDLEKGINFGYDPDGTDPNYPFDGPHYGIDLNYIYDDVYSVVSGIVTVGYEDGGFGNYVMINADDGLTVIYAHLSEVEVGNGQNVVPGDNIGVSGNTGKSSGPHLHFELRQDGKAFNPMGWIEENKYGKTDDNTVDDIDNESKDLIPSYSLKEYLDYGFNDNVAGFTYEIIGEFPLRKEIKTIGDCNLLEHISDGADIYGYVYFAENRHIKIYNSGNYYEPSDYPLIYRYNTDEIQVSTDIKELETYIRGYGAKLTKSETNNYNAIKTTQVKMGGDFIRKGTYRTEKKNAYYEANIKAKWGNEMMEWNMKKGKLGGIVRVNFDGVDIGEYDTYSEDTQTEKVIIGTKIKKGNHKIRVTFIGPSNKGQYEGKIPVMYVGGKNSTVFNSSAILSGDDLYKWYDEYKSPLYDSYTFRQAPTIYLDKADTKQDLRDELIKKIKDEPEVQVTTNYVGNDAIKENSMVRLVHKPMGFNTDLKVKKLTKPHPYSGKRIEVEFTNSQSTILQLQRQLSRNLTKIQR